MKRKNTKISPSGHTHNKANIRMEGRRGGGGSRKYREGRGYKKNKENDNKKNNKQMNIL